LDRCESGTRVEVSEGTFHQPVVRGRLDHGLQDSDAGLVVWQRLIGMRFGLNASEVQKVFGQCIAATRIGGINRHRDYLMSTAEDPCRVLFSLSPSHSVGARTSSDTTDDRHIIQLNNSDFAVTPNRYISPRRVGSDQNSLWHIANFNTLNFLA